MCPKYIAAIKSGKVNPKHPCKFHDMRKKPPGRQLSGKPGYQQTPPRTLKDPKAKAFMSAFQATFANDEASDDENDDEDKDRNGAKDCDADVDDYDLHGFLTMVGSLTE